jgi:prophage regulatory protein
MLGDISRQRAWQITNRDDFPKPVARLMQGMFWFAEDVEEWRDTYRSADAVNSPDGDNLAGGGNHAATVGSVDQAVRTR